MTLFVDASALVAIIAGEPDGDALAEAIIADPDPIWSAMSCWETISGLRRSHDYALHDARAKDNDARLLYKGSDFLQTDLA